MIPVLLVSLLPLVSLLSFCCFKTASIRTQAKKKYKPGHIPVFEDPEKPENSTQYDMKTERFFPKKGEDNPFEEDCREKTEKSVKDKMQLQPPSSGDKKGSSEEKEKLPAAAEAKPAAAPAAAAAAAATPASPAAAAPPSSSPGEKPTQPSVPTPATPAQ